jgi:hypothetical protein
MASPEPPDPFPTPATHATPEPPSNAPRMRRSSPGVPPLAGLATAGLAGLLEVGALYAMPFVAHLDPLNSGPAPPEVFAAFVVGALLVGTALGLTTLLPSKPLRAITATGVALAGQGAMLLSGIGQAFASLHSGDSLIALILLSPIWGVIGLFYLALAGGVSFAVALGANLLAPQLGKLPVAIQGGALAVLLSGSLWVLFRALPATATKEGPVVSAPVAPPPAPLEHCDAILERLSSASGIRVVSVQRVLGGDPLRLEAYLVGVPFFSREQVIAAAAQAIGPRDTCRDSRSPSMWRISAQMATPRPITIHVQGPARPPPGRRQDYEMMVASNVRSAFESGLNPAPEHDGTFQTQLRAGLFGVPGELPVIACDPEGPDLECTPARIHVRQPGAVPSLLETKVDWPKRAGRR